MPKPQENKNTSSAGCTEFCSTESQSEVFQLGGHPSGISGANPQGLVSLLLQASHCFSKGNSKSLRQIAG